MTLSSAWDAYHIWPSMPKYMARGEPNLFRWPSLAIGTGKYRHCKCAFYMLVCPYDDHTLRFRKGGRVSKRMVWTIG